jgi:hypothetical protein
MRFRVIDGCPCPASIAPYVYLVLRRTGRSASSIYRGEDARAILHRHGHKTQREIFDTSPPGVANPPGQSMHELRSDGRAKTGPVGRHLEEWEIGVDSGTNSSHDKRAINAAAAHYGWTTYHPYRAGVEGHHWGFRHQPKPHGLKQRAQIIALRARLPRT